MADLPAPERPVLTGTQQMLLERLREGRTGDAERTAVPPFPGDGPVPLTASQHQVWAVSQLAPDVPLFNDFIVVEVPFPVSFEDASALADSLVALQDALRITVEVIDGKAYQRVNPPTTGTMTTAHAVPADGESDQAAAIRVAARIAAQKFDLLAGPLYRFALISCGARQFLAVCAHHLICDAGSLNLIMRHYAMGNPPPSIRFLDYAAWQSDRESSDAFEPQLAYWRQALKGFNGRVDLPADSPRPVVPSFRGANYVTVCDAQTATGVRALARSEGTTPFVVLLAVLYEVLHRVTGESDLIIGSTVLGRPYPELQTLVGMFVDMVPFRVRREPGMSLRTLVRRTREAVVNAFNHQDVPFSVLTRSLGRRPAQAGSALFSVVFNMPPVDEVDDALLATEYSPGGSQFDLILSAIARAGGLQMNWQYSDIFEAATIERLAGWWGDVLSGALPDPDRALEAIPLVDPAAQVRLALAATGRRVPADPRPVHDLLAATARRCPASTAVDDGEQSVSYGDLIVRAHRLAAALRRRGVRTGDRVATLVRGTDLVTALVATSSVGATLVPLDPAHPPARTSMIFAAARPRAVVVTDATNVHLPFDVSTVVAGEDDVAGPTQDLVGEPVDADLVALLIYTSGSTGTPKGVELTHRALVTHAVAFADACGLTAHDRVLQFASPGFDTAYEQIIGALAAGATIVSRGGADLVADFKTVAAQVRLTIANLPTAVVHSLADDTRPWPAGTELRLLMPGGEALLPGPAQRLIDTLPAGCAVWNLYGPTEAVVTTTRYVLTGDRREQTQIPIGTPLPGRRIYVLDGRGRPVLPGSHGELCIGGDLLARGYAGQPGRTAERFVPDPFGPPGSRLYRTGDRGRWNAATQLEFSGRTDRQVKVLGLRVEPDEIEAVIGALPDVTAVAVVPRLGSDREVRLDAYVSAVAGHDPDPDRIRAALVQLLPAAMVPATVTVLPRLPLGPTGKVDRAALPDPAHEESSPAPDDLVALIGATMAKVLGRARCGPDDDFFSSGGDSLAAVRLTNLLATAIGRPMLTLRDVFAWPTPRSLARCGLRRGHLDAPLTRAARQPGDLLPATRTQHRLWLLEQLSPGRALYAIPSVTHVAQPLDPERLSRAWRAVTARHAVLRTALVHDGTGLRQLIHPAGTTPVHSSLEGLPAGERDRAVATEMARVVGEPFDFAAGPAVRVRAIGLTPGEYLLVVVTHHAICDGDSLRIVVDETLRAYRADSMDESTGAPDFADYADWEDRRPAGDVLRTVEAHRQILAEVPTVLELPTDRPRPAVARFRGGVQALTLDAGPVAAIDECAARLGVTPFTVLLAAFEIVLARWSGQAEFIVGVATRNRDLPGMEGMVGPLADVRPVRARVDQTAGVAQVIVAAREELSAALVAGPVALDLLVEALGVRRDPARNPLFQAVISYQETGPGDTDDDVSPVPVPVGAARFDLALNLQRAGNRVTGGFEFDADLFDDATIAEFGAQLLGVIGTVDGRPEPVVVPPAGSSGTGAVATVPELVADHARRTPDAIALQWDSGQATYADLIAAAAELAAHLSDAGVGHGDVVAVAHRRGPAVAVSILAVLAIGATCLPMDPDLPSARTASLIAQGSPVLVLTDRVPASALPVDLPAMPVGEAVYTAPAAAALLPQRAVPEGTAVLVFTSGSTGTPKAATVSHRSLAALARWFDAELPLPPGGGVLHRTSVAFDVALAEITWALTTGGRLIFAPPGAEHDPAVLEQCIDRHRAAGMIFVPSTLAQYLSRPAGHCADHVRWIAVGGEPLSGDLVRATYQRFPEAMIVNQYGLAETTVLATSQPVPRKVSTAYPAAGRPIDGVRVHVLDRAGRPLPPNGLGEIFVAGQALADGYWRQPSETAANFLPDPFGPPGTRMYRTGDLGRLTTGGALHVAGRADGQVKIRGVRVELGEVEAALSACPGVTDAAARLHRDPGGQPMLVGYVCAGTTLNVTDIRHRMRALVPAAAVPAVVLQLPEIPRTPGGKVARPDLPDPPEPSRDRADDARDDLEHVVIRTFRQVLPVKDIGRTDDFFESGGDSLSAARVVAQIRRLLRVEVSVRAVLTASTPARLAEEITTAEPQPGWAMRAAGAVRQVLSTGSGSRTDTEA
jgi:amino acid adenylation domain-containing protein